MAQHMQQNVPAHLQKYTQGNAYVPQHAEAQLAQAMQKNMPAHLKQYAGAYMQQRIIEPNGARLHAPNSSPNPTPPPPQPNSLRRDHSMFSQQYAVDPSKLSGGQVILPPDQPSQNPVQPNTSSPNPDFSQPQGQPYDFIMNPQKPPKKSFFGGSTSPLIRVAIILVSILLLLLLLIILKNALAGKPKLDSYVTVAQDQQELIHLATNASQQQDLSTNNHNLAATAQLSLASGQSQVLKYLSSNRFKVSAKTLALKVSANTDQQLASAEAAGTYNQTFQSIMQSQLNSYANDMKLAYQQNSGKNGRALLNNQYNQAVLLLQQTNVPANQ